MKIKQRDLDWMQKVIDNAYEEVKISLPKKLRRKIKKEEKKNELRREKRRNGLGG